MGFRTSSLGCKEFWPSESRNHRNKFVKKSLIGLVISKTNITSVFNALHYKGVKFIAN